MRVTTKGQVTIPQHIRKKLGLTATAEIDFIEEKGRFYIVKKAVNTKRGDRFKKLRGVATIRMTTEEIMALTRTD